MKKLLIASIFFIFGCVPNNPPAVSQLFNWSYFQYLGCTLGGNVSCYGTITFFNGDFTAQFTYCNAQVYNYNTNYCGAGNGVHNNGWINCQVNGLWADLNAGSAVGTVVLTNQYDGCYNTLPGTQENDSYNAGNATIEGIP